MSTEAFSVDAAAREAGSRPAVVTSSGITWSYQRLAEEVSGVRDTLVGQGVKLGDYVVLAPERTLDSVTLLHAIWEIGAVSVLLQPSWTAAETERAIHVLPAPALRVDLDQPRWTSEARVQAGRRQFKKTGAMSVCFTSGTTGVPRGVLGTRAQWQSAVTASAQHVGWRDEDRWLLTMPPAHVGGLSILLRCLDARHTVALYNEPRFGADSVRRFIEEERVTLASVVPTMLKRLLQDEAWSPPEALRTVLVGGAACDATLLRRAIDRGLPVRTTYGLSETHGQVTTQRDCPAFDALGDSGVPLPGWKIKEEDGRIFVRGEALFAGYLTESGFVECALDRDGWWETGDWGSIGSSGQLFVRGRGRDMIITGGENVFAAEVEAEIMSMASVEDVGVFGVDDEEWGRAVAAVIVGADFDLENARLELERTLAPHKRPRRWMRAESLPRTASGKLKRGELAERFARGELERL